MHVWSSDDYPVKDRFALWREVRSTHIYGVTAELEADRRPGFSGRFAARKVGEISIGEMQASPYRVSRSGADIARHPGDSLCIYQQLSGACWFETGRDDFVVEAGGIAISHPNLPYRTAPTAGDGFHLRLVKVPFAACRALAVSEGALVPRRLQPEAGLGALFSAYLASFLAQAPRLTEAEAEAAGQILAQLAMAAHGLAGTADEPGRAAVRAARLAALRRHVERNLHRPGLGPTSAAAALGVSVRQIHLLMEGTGTTFARHVLARRLDHARRLLETDPQASVLDIALASGLESPTVFHRAFKAAYGATPADYRRSVVARRRPGA